VLPASVLFLGRAVYWAAIKLVCIVVQQRRLAGGAAEELRALFGVSPETLKRWLGEFAGPVPIASSGRSNAARSAG
jgi:hypothetical protein